MNLSLTMGAMDTSQCICGNTRGKDRDGGGTGMVQTFTTFTPIGITTKAFRSKPPANRTNRKRIVIPFWR